MGMRVAVAGASGYAGGELLRILLEHPQLEVDAVTAGSHAGEPVSSVHPHLPRLAQRSFAATEPAAFADADLVFLALPHGQSAGIADGLPAGTRVVDLGADYRLTDASAWDRFYESPYAGSWVYGVPELPGGRQAIASAGRVANSGCYAVAAELAFAPMVRAGLVEPGDLVAVAASGTTGAGRSAKPHLLGSEVMGSMSPYKTAGAHQHTPEIEQALAALGAGDVSLSLTPMLAPMPRGILATCTGRLRPGVTEGDLRAAFDEAYSGEPFVHVLREGMWPRTADTVGSNAAHVQVAADHHAGRAVACLALDNLGKGAAGQAVQNANLLLGIEEAAGLTAQGVAP